MTFWRRLFRAAQTPRSGVFNGNPTQVLVTASPKIASATVKESFGEAIKRGDAKRVQALLADNPDVVFGEGKLTPLHTAAIYGACAVAKMLLTKGVGGDPRDAQGQTPLHIAAFAGQKEMLELLLANKAEVDSRDNYGYTPLHRAASVSWNKGRMAEPLLADGADINAKNNDGETPLQKAAACGNKAMVELLLAHGADANVTNAEGRTPMEVVQAVIEAANLDRWKSSAESSAWVSKRLQGWNQNDWLELLSELRNSQYWPMNETAVDQHIEAVRHALARAGKEPWHGPREGSIRDVTLIIESIVLSMTSSGVIQPPAMMVQSIDQELANSGHIRQGEFAAYVAKSGFARQKIMGALTDDQRLAIVQSLYPSAKWACCGRVTQMSRYNIVVAFWD